MSAPLRPVGDQSPSTETSFVSALVWSAAADVLAAAERVRAEDFADPHLAEIFGCVTEVARDGKPHLGTSLLVELERRGKLTDPLRRRLHDAVTAGASDTDLHYWAEAVAAQAYRRRFADLGEALAGVSQSLPERDLLPWLRSQGALIAAHALRLEKAGVTA